MQVGPWRRRLAQGATLVVVSVALMGVAHTPWAGKLWLRATGSACPFGFGASLAEQDARYQRQSVALKQGKPAPAKPALGFTLLTTSREDFLQRLAAAGGRCTHTAKNLQVECGAVDLGKLQGPDHGELASVMGDFDLHGKLRSVMIVARAAGPLPALSAVQRAVQTASVRLGPPTQQVGTPEVAFLEAAPLRQIKTSFAFSDYYAEILATNMGNLGYYSVIETYKTL